MRTIRAAAFIVAAVLALATASVQSSANPTGSQASVAAAPAAAAAAVHHLVYEFGYNTKAAKQGPSTGTTTIDIVGVAADGGMTVNATDEWWNSVNPKQTATCEVYANSNVTCSKAPYNLTVIQASVLPFLAQSFFAPVSGGSGAKWNANYNVKASFAPGIHRGFAGQVNTWAFALNVTDKGTTPDSAPLILVHYDGTIKEQGGRYTNLTQEANILFDPRLKMPVLVTNLSRFVPQKTTSSYSIELKLAQYK
jgi:hypothetical protein